MWLLRKVMRLGDGLSRGEGHREGEDIADGGGASQPPGLR